MYTTNSNQSSFKSVKSMLNNVCKNETVIRKCIFDVVMRGHYNCNVLI